MPLSIRRIKGSQSHADMRAAPIRKDISLPVGLISTTNMLSYEAPDLPIAQKMMAARVSSDNPTPTPISPPQDVPSLTPDGSSAGSSPAVEYNHLSAYFPGPTVKRSPSARQAQAADLDAPAIPKRVPSHSKREHERLARKRSLHTSGKSSPATSSPSSPTLSATDNGVQRTSLELMGVNAPEPPPKMSMNPTRHRSPTVNNNPFSPELEKLNEVAEDLKSPTDDPAELEDEDTIHMRRLGLAKFAATDYRNDIGTCYPKSPFNVGFTFQENAGGWI